MAEYIDRTALKSQIAENKLMAREPAAKRILAMIDDMPAADVTPIVHGHWILVNPPVDLIDWEECSVCGYENFYFSRFKFCPNCGAKMDEVTK